MVACLVVDCDFNLVCLVDAEVVDLVGPAVVPCRLGTALDGVFDLDVDKSFWAPTKAPSGRVINIGNGMYAQRQLAAQRLSLTGNVETIVCAMVSVWTS